MSKRYCVWCGLDAKHEDYGDYCKDGMFAIHYECFFEATETTEDINKLLKNLKEIPGKTEEMISLIKRMERWQQRSAGTTQILRDLKVI